MFTGLVDDYCLLVSSFMLEAIWAFVKAHPVAVALSVFFLFRFISARFAKEVVVEGSRVVTVGSLQEFDEVLKSNKIVIADFYANWCPGCVHAAPDFARLSKVFTNVCFVKINTDVAQDVARKFNISVLPTFKVFTMKKEVHTLTGFKKADVVDKLESVGGIAQIE